MIYVIVNLVSEDGKCVGCGKIVCRSHFLKGWSKRGAGSVRNVCILRMKRGDLIPKRLAGLFRRFNFGFSFLPKSSARHSLFQISTFQFFISTCSEPLLGVRRAPGSRAQLLCRLVCKFKRFCRTIFATDRTTIDTRDAYYFGNVDKISTRAARLRDRISTAKTPQLTSKHLYFQRVSFLKVGRLRNFMATTGMGLSESNELGLRLALF